jgi:hypothetical protein
MRRRKVKAKDSQSKEVVSDSVRPRAQSAQSLCLTTDAFTEEAVVCSKKVRAGKAKVKDAQNSFEKDRQASSKYNRATSQRADITSKDSASEVPSIESFTEFPTLGTNNCSRGADSDGSLSTISSSVSRKLDFVEYESASSKTSTSTSPPNITDAAAVAVPPIVSPSPRTMEASANAPTFTPSNAYNPSFMSYDQLYMAYHHQCEYANALEHEILRLSATLRGVGFII